MSTLADSAPFRLPTAPVATDLVAKYFRGLGDPIRLRILELLRAEGELSVGELVVRLGLPQPQVSNHLACLRGCWSSGWPQSCSSSRRSTSWRWPTLTRRPSCASWVPPRSGSTAVTSSQARASGTSSSSPAACTAPSAALAGSPTRHGSATRSLSPPDDR